MSSATSATLGEKFRQRREERHVSLKEIETATSIRVNYLQAIEDDTILRVIPPVYAQGFIRQYAQFLEMDGDQVFRDHPELLRRPENQDFNYGIGTLEKRSAHPASVKGVPNVFWFFILVAVFGAAWYMAKVLEVL